FRATPFPHLNESIYDRFRERPEYRVALDLTGPFPQNLRHNGLSTPQGFDPFLPKQYQILVERLAHFRSNREFDISLNEAALRIFGVGYFVGTESGPLWQQLSSNSRFRLMQPDDQYYKAFEYVDAVPAFSWEGQGSAQRTIWEPERRAFAVRSALGGRFRLSEQYYP